MGELAVSRALGDCDFKVAGESWDKQIVTAEPEQYTGKLDDESEFFILACDGLVIIKSLNLCLYYLFILHFLFSNF